jgi:hypothetical protein
VIEYWDYVEGNFVDFIVQVNIPWNENEIEIGDQIYAHVRGWA